MDLQKIINQEKVSIVDVRTPLETMLGMATGATNIPLGKIEKRIEEFRQMDKPIVLYCRSGNRSGQALNYLKAQGVEEVYNGGSLSEMKALLKSKS